MRKLLLFIITILFLGIYNVYAEECKINSIEIEPIGIKEKSKDVENLANPTLENNKLKLNLKMYDVGDYIEYEIKVKNKSNENYYFDESSINNNSNYFIYSLSYEDKSIKIEPGKSKTIYLRVEYTKEVEKQKFFSGKYIDHGNTPINLVNRNPLLTNPLTKSNNIIFILVIFLIIQMVLLFKWNNKKTIMHILILSTFLFIPITTYALCKENIDIEANIIIGRVKPNPCTYNGELVQGAEYINGQYTYRYMKDAINNSLTEDGWGLLLTDKESTNPVTTKMCTSINGKPIVSMYASFAYSKTTSIDLSSFDTSNVTNMSGMFVGVANVEEYDISSFDTSNVNTMVSMFNSNTSLKKIDLHYFDTSKANNLNAMFLGDENLEEINLDGFDLTASTNAVSIIAGMFIDLGKVQKVSMRNWKLPESIIDAIGCRSTGLCSHKLEYIDVTGWDLSKTKSIQGLFANSYVKEIIGLDTWDTSNITNMNGMFQSDYNIKELDLSSFDTRNVTSTKWMFMDDSNLKTIKVSNKFTTNNITIDNSYTMFQNCTSLVGGNGTVYDSNHTDKEYARIDKSGTPGYFTKK